MYEKQCLTSLCAVFTLRSIAVVWGGGHPMHSCCSCCACFGGGLLMRDDVRHSNGSKIASLMIDIVECAYKTLHAIKGPSEEEVERFTRQIPRPSHDEIQRFVSPVNQPLSAPLERISLPRCDAYTLSGLSCVLCLVCLYLSSKCVHLHVCEFAPTRVS